MNRREFLRVGAGGLALAAVGPYVWGVQEQKALRVGVIGAGWYGKCDLYRLMQVAPVDVVSLCDVDQRMLDDAAEQVAARQASKKRPRVYGDYREMLKEKDLDVVIVGTPDHWHALPTIAAIEAGADVYVQKPISVDVKEGEAMVAAARKHNRVVQVGTQRRSTPHLVEARKLIQEGKLGKVGVVEICSYVHMRNGTNPPDEKPPEGLDWEMWTGPAPMRGYNKIVHPRGWRNFMEYGNGIVGDMGIHFVDAARWMLGLGWPKSVASTGGVYMNKETKANISDTQSAVWDFGDVQMVWQHRTWGDPVDPKYPWGAIFYGDKGTLKISVMSYDFIPRGGGPEAVHKDVTYELEQFPGDQTEKQLEKHVAPAIRYHMKDFLSAIGSRSKPVADIEEGHISTASCILANVSMQVGRTLRWDAEKGEVVGDAEANRLLKREYRKPWVHPAEG
jgi:predicted dehydrogenase